jgi:hypothetical protein
VSLMLGRPVSIRFYVLIVGFPLDISGGSERCLINEARLLGKVRPQQLLLFLGELALGLVRRTPSEGP